MVCSLDRRRTIRDTIFWFAFSFAAKCVVIDQIFIERIALIISNIIPRSNIIYNVVIVQNTTQTDQCIGPFTYHGVL